MAHRSYYIRYRYSNWNVWIAVSANAFDEDREASRAAGMNGHLAKPIIAADLLEMLGKIIQGL